MVLPLQTPCAVLGGTTTLMRVILTPGSTHICLWGFVYKIGFHVMNMRHCYKGQTTWYFEIRWASKSFNFFYKSGFAFFIRVFCRSIGFGLMLEWPVLFNISVKHAITIFLQYYRFSYIIWWASNFSSHVGVI